VCGHVVHTFVNHPLGHVRSQLLQLLFRAFLRLPSAAPHLLLKTSVLSDCFVNVLISDYRSLSSRSFHLVVFPIVTLIVSCVHQHGYPSIGLCISAFGTPFVDFGFVIVICVVIGLLCVRSTSVLRIGIRIGSRLRA